MPLIYFHVNFISQRSCLLKKKNYARTNIHIHSYSFFTTRPTKITMWIIYMHRQLNSIVTRKMPQTLILFK